MPSMWTDSMFTMWTSHPLDRRWSAISVARLVFPEQGSPVKTTRGILRKGRGKTRRKVRSLIPLSSAASRIATNHPCSVATPPGPSELIRGDRRPTSPHPSSSSPIGPSTTRAGHLCNARGKPLGGHRGDITTTTCSSTEGSDGQWEATPTTPTTSTTPRETTMRMVLERGVYGMARDPEPFALRGGLPSALDCAVTYKEHKEPKMVGAYYMGNVVEKVKEAVDSQSLRRVAVKIVNMRFLRRLKNAAEGVRREVSILRKLHRHENVLELVDVIQNDDKQKYIVTEFAGGGSLRQLIEDSPNGQMAPNHARWYFRQIVNGLGHIHGHGVVHRDIKPSNMLLTPSGVLKISDFGVSEVLDRFTGTDMVSKTSGSPAFQPPELASGKESYSGFKQDIWALGITLYFMVVGRVPFDGATLADLYSAIARADVDIPPRLDPALVGLLRGLLEPDPEQRLGLDAIRRHPWLTARREASRIEIRRAIQSLPRFQAMPRSPSVLVGMNNVEGLPLTPNDARSSLVEEGRRGCIVC